MSITGERKTELVGEFKQSENFIFDDKKSLVDFCLSMVWFKSDFICDMISLWIDILLVIGLTTSINNALAISDAMELFFANKLDKNLQTESIAPWFCLIALLSI